MKKLLIILTLAAIIATPKAQAASFQNGSFEQNNNLNITGPFDFITLGNGSTNITGWTVTGDSIDYINTYWNASNGQYSLDLAGNHPGGIEQTFTTTPGITYNVSFDLSGNPVLADDPNPKDVKVSVGVGSYTNDFTYDVDIMGNTAGPNGDMKWQTENFSFLANSDNTTLSFITNEADSPCGPALDNVNVIPAPEPSSMVLGFMSIPSIMGFLGFRRRKN